MLNPWSKASMPELHLYICFALWVSWKTRHIGYTVHLQTIHIPDSYMVLDWSNETIWMLWCLRSVFGYCKPICITTFHDENQDGFHFLPLIVMILGQICPQIAQRASWPRNLDQCQGSHCISFGEKPRARTKETCFWVAKVTVLLLMY